MKPLIYIASPYTKGDMILNIRHQINVFDELKREGIVTPISPLIYAFVEITHPDKYENWMNYDLDLIEHCDGVYVTNTEVGDYIQLAADSKGVKMEIKHALENTIPVWYNKKDMYWYFTEIVGKE
jgi:hypothetical protein